MSEMVREAGIRQILALLGIADASITSDAATSTPPVVGRDRFELDADGRRLMVDRVQARLLVFLMAPLHEWLDGGKPSGAESDLRWSIVALDGMDLLEIRVADRPPLRLDKSAAANALMAAADLRKFARGY
jgi:hypothetical protein